MQIEEITGTNGFTETLKISGVTTSQEAIEIAENWCEEHNSFFEESTKETEGVFFVNVWPDGP